jgi:DNA modification methylase
MQKRKKVPSYRKEYKRRKKRMKIQLYNEDCLQLLKKTNSGSVDLVLIDPPYTISRKTGLNSCGPKGVERFKMSYEFGEWDNELFDLLPVMNEAYRVLRDGGTIICFYDIWKMQTLKDWMEVARFKQVRFIEWIKTNPVPINSKVNYLTNSREIALTAVKKGKGVFHSKYDNGIYHYPICHERDRFHPTQKPLPLLEALIRKHSDEGAVVLDCFAGSASTGVAAYNCGRTFIGCEIDETYYNKSVERIGKLNDKSRNVPPVSES